MRNEGHFRGSSCKPVLSQPGPQPGWLCGLNSLMKKKRDGPSHLLAALVSIILKELPCPSLRGDRAQMAQTFGKQPFVCLLFTAQSNSATVCGTQ